MLDTEEKCVCAHYSGDFVQVYFLKNCCVSQIPIIFCSGMNRTACSICHALVLPECFQKVETQVINCLMKGSTDTQARRQLKQCQKSLLCTDFLWCVPLWILLEQYHSTVEGNAETGGLLCHTGEYLHQIEDSPSNFICLSLILQFAI